MNRAGAAQRYLTTLLRELWEEPRRRSLMRDIRAAVREERTIHQEEMEQDIWQGAVLEMDEEWGDEEDGVMRREE